MACAEFQVLEGFYLKRPTRPTPTPRPLRTPYATTVANAAVGRTSDVTACDTAGYSITTVATIVGRGRVAVAHVPITRGCITSSAHSHNPYLPNRLRLMDFQGQGEAQRPSRRWQLLVCASVTPFRLRLKKVARCPTAKHSGETPKGLSDPLLIRPPSRRATVRSRSRIHRRALGQRH